MVNPKLPMINYILYADDDTDDIEFVKDALQGYEHNVEIITFFNGKEAIEFLHSLSPEQSTPCLIILDINMPFLSGRETLKKLREHERFIDVPVILFSTSSATEDKEFAANHNAGFITKPIDCSQMESIAKTFLQHCSNDIKENLKRLV